jgi:dihydrofolate reductase
MRKLILYMIVTLDGLIAGLEDEFDDYEPSDEEMRFANEFFGSMDAILFGRVIHQLFVDYWDVLDESDPSIRQVDREFAAIFKSKPRVVFSRTLEQADDRTRVIKDNLAAEVASLKAQPGRDLLLLCGPELLATLVGHGLVDEYRLLVRPTVLGRGKALFGALGHKLDLKLAASRVFDSGVVMQQYLVR